MTDTPDASPTIRIEGQPKEYDPRNDPLMHRVIVKDHVAPGIEPSMEGYKTSIPGAKVNLQELAEFNKPHQERGVAYDSVYVTTASGTIYRARNLPDGSLQVEGTSSPTQNTIREACTLEVGKRFQSPHLVNGKPELDTSPVQDITLVNTHQWIQSQSSGIEETDIAARFTHVRQNPKT